MATKYNLKSPGTKRLMREASELAEPTEDYCANPLDDNLFEWHFTVRGPPNTEFEGGFYHGRIILPSEYPMKPPDIILLTPNGRFETNKKICLSISGHHPETWQPSWSIRTALVALIAFMPTSSIGAIGSLNYTPEERQSLAKRSKNWECEICGKISEKLRRIEQKDTETEAILPIQRETLAASTQISDQDLSEQLERLVDNEQQANIDVQVNFDNGLSWQEQFLAPALFVIIASIMALIIRRLYGLSLNNSANNTETKK